MIQLSFESAVGINGKGRENDGHFAARFKAGFQKLTTFPAKIIPINL